MKDGSWVMIVGSTSERGSFWNITGDGYTDT